MKVSVHNCSRCGESHKDVEFKELARPSAGFQLWAPCPTNGEPILINAGGGDQGLRHVMHVSHGDLAERIRELLKTGGLTVSTLSAIAELVQEPSGQSGLLANSGGSDEQVSG